MHQRIYYSNAKDTISVKKLLNIIDNVLLSDESKLSEEENQIKIKYEILLREENELKENLEKIAENFNSENDTKNLKLIKYFNSEQQLITENKGEIIDTNKLLNMQYQLNKNADLNILNEMFTISIEEKQIKINGFSLIYNFIDEEVNFINFLIQFKIRKNSNLFFLVGDALLI